MLSNLNTIIGRAYSGVVTLDGVETAVVDWEWIAGAVCVLLLMWGFIILLRSFLGYFGGKR